MKIALLQSQNIPLDVESNLGALRAAAAEAVSAGAELLLTPELFVTGYAPRALAEWLTTERVAQLPERVALIAAEQGIAIAASLPGLAPAGGFEITAELWDAAGESVLRYGKVHLWDEAERSAFVPSERAPEVAEWNGRTVGFQVCYDIEFAEPTRYLATLGADLVLVPTAITPVAAYIPELLVRARAAENNLVVAYADHAATPGEGFAGLSTVAGREGQLLAVADAAPGLLVAELPEVAPLEGEAADYLADRRPELYASWPARA
ncbi:nitrilase-related carbon-nitrogen hydrolase [Leucobacter sp. M11]|uniref:nitrilase-related carbon-nitrogen hydrolase n=1 Tax=Leucobacter sp. M11 TaxID=2993565 RepID=UPI002D7F8121|nr:nitrilase-related carbon-nitrogen hydrolase [Leucobacter sp. M11]MEB4613822.1 nitrilase [Leucobacter sp. M11]